MKRILKRELKMPEITEREANGTSHLGKIVIHYGENNFLQRDVRSSFAPRSSACYGPNLVMGVILSARLLSYISDCLLFRDES